MDINAVFSKLTDRCNIYYDDKIISKENIIRNYLSFFSKQFDEEERKVSFSFHTGSICFDAAALIAVILGALAFDISSNDDILNSLSIGDMVIYRDERYKWGGITLDTAGPFANEPYCILTQDAKGKDGILTTKAFLKKNKHRIKPYYGKSKKTDGRGIRRSKSGRTAFLSAVLDIPENEVPSSFGISVAVISPKEKFIELCNNIKIVYSGQAAVSVTDIVPVSYYNSSYEEIQIGKNPSKEEAFIKIASNVSTARKIVLDKSGNSTIGLLALEIDSLQNVESELCDMLRRKSLKFIHIASTMNSDMQTFALKKNENAEIFACTKKHLSNIDCKLNCSNELTNELFLQINNTVNRKLNIIDIEGFEWKEYLGIKRGILTVKKSNLPDDEKNKFIIAAYGMLNLLTAAFFSIDKMELATENGEINPSLSPKQILTELYGIAETAGSLKDVCFNIADSLNAKYSNLLRSSNKEFELLRLLQTIDSGKTAVIVPKAYYTDIFSSFFRSEFLDMDITCITVNKFDEHKLYDNIVSVGNITGKNFDILQCTSAGNIYVLLYDCENQIFLHRKKKMASYDRMMNLKMNIDAESTEQDIVADDDKDNMQNTREIFELDRFVEELSTFNIGRAISSGSIGSGSGTMSAEVNYIGTFTTGEQILFSKYYSAVVFNAGERKVIEVTADKLSQGDVIVFTKKNDYTRNIADIIFDQLKNNNRLEGEITKASSLAAYWKKCLLNYKESHNLSYKALTESLKKHNGITVQGQTVRQWLVPESHIIGPRNENAIIAIGKLVGDENMISNSSDYFNACRTVRHYRREILSMIAQAINDSLSMNRPAPGSPFEIVYKNIENLSDMFEIETIHELDKAITVNANIVNKPISLDEMEMLL